MASWQELLRKKSIASLEALIARFGPDHFPDLDRLRQAARNFEFRISPAMVDLITAPGDPIWRQYVPDLQELEVHDGMVDSLAEDANSPVPNITHRYPDRALFLVSPVCASYCRFCTRRRKVGDPEKIPMAQLESAFRYLAEHPEIRDVIMSGGDPLLLSDRRIDEICKRLLRGVNDDPEVMKLLMQRLLVARVRPYYIYMCDQVAGAEHFRTTVEKGLEIIKALRGWTSGLAVPHFVIDAPGGGGKIPLLPEYVVKLTDKEVILRNYTGKLYRYKQGAKEPALDPILVG